MPVRLPLQDGRRFSDALSVHGIRVLWERADRCTCWNPESEQPDYHCAACGGLGYVYGTAIEEHEGAFFAGLVLNKDFTGQGDWRMGDITGNISFEIRRQETQQYEPNPLYWCGTYDRFTLLDAHFRTHDLLIRDKARVRLAPNTLRYSHVHRVERIMQADPASGAITEYLPDVDYTVDGPTIQWVTGRGPTPGAPYSVTYWHAPVYLVYRELPQSRDGMERTNLPRRLVLRFLDDMFQ